MLHPSQRCSPSRTLELALTLDLSFAQSAQEPATNSEWLPLHMALQARADSKWCIAFWRHTLRRRLVWQHTDGFPCT